MKKSEREVYLNLSSEVHATLCTFCKYSESVSEGCCEGYMECQHPIDKLHDTETMLEPNIDCWGFKHSLTLDVIVDIVASILSQNYDQWAFRTYSKKAITVYGKSFDDKFSGKVRIGHNGKDGKIIMEHIKICGRCYDEVGELFPANCTERPEKLIGQPLGQYHCPDCGAMIIAGLKHPDLCKNCLDRKHPTFDFMEDK